MKVNEMTYEQLVDRAFDWHWNHDCGECLISLNEFKKFKPDSNPDTDVYIANNRLYYRSSSHQWSIDLEYLES